MLLSQQRVAGTLKQHIEQKHCLFVTKALLVATDVWLLDVWSVFEVSLQPTVIPGAAALPENFPTGCGESSGALAERAKQEDGCGKSHDTYRHVYFSQGKTLLNSAMPCSQPCAPRLQHPPRVLGP